jgi:predicted nucleic acid-binding protein
MTLEEALRGVFSILLDTAPAVYHLENHPKYAKRMTAFFAARDLNRIRLVTTPVTLMECLVDPIRRGTAELQASYFQLMTEGDDTMFHPVGIQEAGLAAQMRAKYDLRLADAFQAAIAIRTGCQAILTNDAAFRKVSEFRAVILDELTP